MIGRCQFLSCESMLAHQVNVVDAQRGTQRVLVCGDHERLLQAAVAEGYLLGVTPKTIYGTQVSGGTVWINTIADFWFGRRYPL